MDIKKYGYTGQGYYGLDELFNYAVKQEVHI